MNDATPDVLVVGTGPAGLIAAAACHAQGLRTVCVGSDPDRLWPNLYGIWEDQVADSELRGAMTATWPSVEVRHRSTDTVRRGYGRVDNAAWQAILAGRIAPVERFAAAGWVADDRGVTVFDAAGGSRRAAVVVDATGAAGPLLERRGGPSLFQVAWGELVDADALGDEPRWMDFGDEAGVPTFLYALPMPDGRWFVEETSLVSRAPMSHAALRDRLHRRLAREGVTVRATHRVERCRIAMDVPVPDAQRIVGFGAAAGMIHPATGYLLPRLLEDAPRLAAAIASGLARDSRTAAARAWDAVWPRARRRQHQMYRLGAQVLAGLDADDTRAFFAGFFALPEPSRTAYLADQLSPAGIAAVMAATFARLPHRLRFTVARRTATHWIEESP